ncbi:DUF1642 domain-containing protein [Listeria monocytogenes]|uniref:DUF1642 domain-containing protein n=1 Tax=Listeria monocytogenes TaxID=1639 RepID=UPI000B58A92E|nr:DUF1642 domain-containing protein [Listeria monocytogenes]ASH35192.1 conserved hypothetical phage protein [Listeria monocytogenes serotype 1/2b str. 10-0810]ASH38163.1 conserved hypothetical phage protein [Listeria monocytogenes serotype 1/2b str. 10-0811]EHG7524636.1 DUF1642 domain-containing protein [Listeria monocytogenes]HAA9554127.1 DUF1642 domain-containing protein [Listeria monocytogenes]HAA9557130.1 DUF1642 domain-containing protein [Listeria monocytogenes]
MRFKKGDKVEFIYGGTLTQGVVNEIRATNHDISYQIVYFGGEKKIWFAERELLSPAPVLKVPQCVADWYEKYKCALEYSIWKYIYEWADQDYESDFYSFMNHACNNPIETLIKMKYGYEVEKEPLYYVQLIRRLSGYLNVRNDESSFLDSPYEVGLNKTKFTEAEIKAMDERYWQFAVPVKDLEEK